MAHRLRIHHVSRWTDFNDHEGEIHGELDGLPVTAYVLVARAESWQSYRPGATVDVEAWLERSGEAVCVPKDTVPGLSQASGVVYDITGVITQRDDEQVRVASSVDLRVDLDASSRTPVSEWKVGDAVRVRGILKVELVGPARE